MTADKPSRRIPNNVKQVLFVVGVLWLLVHLFALAVTLYTRIAMPFAAVLFIDALGALIGGLMWLARRIFPTAGEER